MEKTKEIAVNKGSILAVQNEFKRMALLTTLEEVKGKKCSIYVAAGQVKTKLVISELHIKVDDNKIGLSDKDLNSTMSEIDIQNSTTLWIDYQDFKILEDEETHLLIQIDDGMTFLIDDVE